MTKCPECGKSMEEESIPLHVSDISPKTQRLSKMTRSKHFRCEHCDSEYTKVGNGELTKITEPGRGQAEPLQFNLEQEENYAYNEDSKP